jgi:hypothetical protein
VRHIGDRLRDLWRNSDALSEAIGWAAANWLLDAACLWCFIAALGRYIDPILLFAAYGIGNVVAVIPLMPGGLGLVEVTTIGLLTASGLSPSVATLGVLGWRLVNFWLPIPVGAGCYISLRTQRSSGFFARGKAIRTITEDARTAAADVPPTGGAVPE